VFLPPGVAHDLLRNALMDDAELLRYSRHILLPELGVDAQQQFSSAHALIVGVGGLGSPVALFLAAAGVGRLTLCDADRVDLTNLQRQLLFDTSQVGQAKVAAARARLAAVNPQVSVAAVQERVDVEALRPLVEQADVVIDCSDNFETRHALNRCCVEARKPLVSGAAIRFDGQVAVFDPREASSPCYQCLFPSSADADETRCATMGVFAPLIGIVGSTQAAEALKILAGSGVTLAGRLLIIDALSMEWRQLRIAKDPACPVCSGAQHELRGHEADTAPSAALG
jgi:molybdopterin/thiamine biosynthesis adenylyltransferase